MSILCQCDVINARRTFACNLSVKNYKTVFKLCNRKKYIQNSIYNNCKRLLDIFSKYLKYNYFILSCYVFRYFLV